MIQTIKKLIPTSVKRPIRGYMEGMAKPRLFGPLAPLVPAGEDMFEGPASLKEFKKNGEEFFRIYKDVCGLQPDEKMLDVGCGIGRKTLPLTQYFSGAATYDGIDITSAGIEWCSNKITPRFPNFKFQHINVYNKHYNPLGKFSPSEYKFPFDDEFFTFVVLGSVFTHMLPGDLSNYLMEVRRVLTKGGRCLITYFLLNSESLGLSGANKGTIDFVFEGGIYRMISKDMPELGIAYDETWIKDLYQKVGLEQIRVDYGSWCGRQDYLSYQDLILALKD